MRNDKFFNSQNCIKSNLETELATDYSYLDAIRAFAHLSNASIYVIDYEKQGFEYVCDNPLFLCGNTSSDVKNMGYEFYSSYVPQEDLEMLLEINQIGFNFFEQQPIQKRKDFTISYDFHLLYPGGKRILIKHKLTPFVLTQSGKLWKAICLVEVSSAKQAGNIRITNHTNGKSLYYDRTAKYWREEVNFALSCKEKQMIELSIRGYSIKEIAEQMHVSNETVKFYRRNIFNKLQVKSISEAIFKIK